MIKNNFANFSKYFTFVAMIWLVTLSSFAIISSNADDLDEVQAALGAKGEVREGALIVRYPRSDLSVYIEGEPVPTALGFVSWLAWKTIGDQVMVIGNLVLLEKEVNPVISALGKAKINVTALHNHFIWDKPRIMFMHIQAVGKGIELARAIKTALDKTETPRVPGGLPQSPLSLDTGRLEQIIGYKGSASGGTFTITVDRAGVTSKGMEITSGMGMNSWVGFIGTNERAHVAGYLALTGAEVDPAVSVLRGGGIDILAVHSQMLDEVPRIFFVHYWGTGPVETLAGTVRSALQQAQGTVK